jgi:DNA-binding transcriptional LysR family regulator
MDRFQAMRAFVAVVEAGSFVGAADALGMSKAAVSRQVADLEARLGVRLLHRTTRRLSLTDEGQVFHGRSKDVLATLDEAEAELTARSGEAVGTLRVTAPVSFALLHLTPMWPGFLARHPRLKLELTLSDRFVDLVDEGIDVAVRIARLESSTLVSRRLATTTMVLCASPRYLKKRGRPKDLHELADHDVVAYSLLSTGDEWHFVGSGGPASVRVNPRMHTNSGDTCRAMALGHSAIVFEPSFMVADDLAAGRLVRVLPEYSGLELGIYAVYPSRRHVLPKVRVFIDHLAQAFRHAQWDRAAIADTPVGEAPSRVARR